MGVWSFKVASSGSPLSRCRKSDLGGRPIGLARLCGSCACAAARESLRNVSGLTTRPRPIALPTTPRLNTRLDGVQVCIQRGAQGAEVPLLPDQRAQRCYTVCPPPQHRRPQAQEDCDAPGRNDEMEIGARLLILSATGTSSSAAIPP